VQTGRDFCYYRNVSDTKPDSAPNVKPADGKPVSLRELAAYLGLSRSTISLVLNDSPVAQGLKPETRERVRKAAAELHYKPNYFARMLNNKRSQMVGILTPDLSQGYDSEILNGIERLLVERDYLYFVSSHQWRQDLIRQRLKVFAERGAEGILLINTRVMAAPELPQVSIGSLESAFPQTRILVDNALGARLALEHLHTLGHREIALIKGHTQSSDAEPRFTASMDIARQMDLRIPKDRIVRLERLDNGLNPIREGYLAGQQLLRAARPFTALLAFNDLSAIGAMNAFRDAGKRIPEDISVVGFDDVQAATIVYPALTTIRQPLARIGALAASELLASIEDPALEPRRILIAPELVLRQSTAPCRP
jgi:LacI family transcriptional regulator